MKFIIPLIYLIGVTFAQFGFRAEDCSTISKAYCMNEKQYVLCSSSEGGEAPAMLNCPIDGEYCSSDVASSCTSNKTLRTANTHCNTCVAGHACLSFTSFKTCEEGAPSGEEKFCAAGLYCNVFHANRANPCSRFSGQQLMCWKEYKAPAPPTNAEICEKLNKEGNHEYENDTDCTQFRACSKDEVTDEWVGSIMKCPQATFYDPLIRACVPAVIYKCPKPQPPPN